MKPSVLLLFILIQLVSSCASKQKMWVANRWKNGGRIAYEGWFDLARAEKMVPCLSFRFLDHSEDQTYIPHRMIPIHPSMVKDEPGKKSHVYYIRHKKENFWLQNTRTGSVTYQCFSPRELHRNEDYYNAYNDRYEKIKYLNETVKDER